MTVDQDMKMAASSTAFYIYLYARQNYNNKYMDKWGGMDKNMLMEYHITMNVPILRSISLGSEVFTAATSALLSKHQQHATVTCNTAAGAQTAS